MRRRRQSCALAAAIAASATLAGCTGLMIEEPLRWQSAAASALPSVDGSLICQSLANRFVGLPTSHLPWGDVAPTPPPSVGRWWVRSCSARAMGADLQIHLRGPGWYWVDQAGGGMKLSQQVPFELDLGLRGRFQMAIESGVLSLDFRPSAEPLVALQSPPELQVQSVSAWGALLSVVPGVSPARRAGERFHREAAESLRAQLQQGATFTYALGAGQTDATLGQLPPGEMPPRPFGESSWVVNERLLLAPKAVQVLGPIERGAKHLNVIVERGPGVSYRAICADGLRDHFEAVRNNELGTLPGAAWVASGIVTGAGEHTLSLDVRSCSYFLVTSSVQAAYTLADVLVRS